MISKEPRKCSALNFCQQHTKQERTAVFVCSTAKRLIHSHWHSHSHSWLCGIPLVSRYPWIPYAAICDRDRYSWHSYVPFGLHNTRYGGASLHFTQNAPANALQFPTYFCVVVKTPRILHAHRTARVGQPQQTRAVYCTFVILFAFRPSVVPHFALWPLNVQAIV